MALGSTKTFATNQAVPTGSNGDTRYGLCGLLDSRSKYNTNWFPEPLNTDEMDGDQEFRLNWLHTEKHGVTGDEVSAEVEKSFGQLSMEFEFPFEHDAEKDDGNVDNTDGIGNIEVSARHPFYQFVSSDEAIDLTLGANVELGVATGSDVSKNTELVGGLYETLGLGNHFSLQARVGWSHLFGPGEDGGANTLEYAAVFGYNIDMEKDLGVSRFTPIFEIDGETALNHDESGGTNLDGLIGVIVNFDSNKLGEPKIGVGYLFPLSDDAREDFRWGVETSLIWEY